MKNTVNSLLGQSPCTDTKSFRVTGVVFGLLALLLSFASYDVKAQSAYPVGFQSTVVYDGNGNNPALNTPGGIAVDAVGNLYVANYANNDIVLATFQSNGTYVYSTIGSGFNSPQGVAVDASGNVFVADTNNNRVVELAYSTSGYTQTTIWTAAQSINISGGITYIENPTGIAVDTNGAIYLTDPSTGYVVKLSGSGWGTETILDSNSTTAEPTSQPEGIAVDTSFNVYIADYGSGLIKLPWTGSGYGTATLIGSTSLRPYGVAVDAQLNVYVANYSSSATAASVVEEILQYNGTYVASTLATGLKNSNAIAVDNRYNAYVSVKSQNDIVELSPFNGNFGNVNIGSTSKTLTVTFQFLQPGTLSQILAVQKGNNNGEFAILATQPSGACAVGVSYAQGATCTVAANFTPQYSGTRYGAVELMNSYNQLFGTAYVFGTGVGPQVVFLPGTQQQLALNMDANLISGLAADGLDNVFVDSFNDSYIYELTAASNYATVNRIGGYFTSLSDAQTDGAGDVYATDWNTGVCYKIFALDNYQTMIAMDTGLSNPSGTAIDGNGNVYITSAGSGTVTEVLAASDYTTIVKIASGFSVPSDLAVDGSGDVFVLNYGTGTVSEVLAVNGAVPSNPTINTVATGLSGPQSVKVDNNGNLYVAEQNANRVDEFTVVSNFATKSTVATVQSAIDMALDGQGNLFVNGQTSGVIYEFSTGTPPSLYFKTTVVGSTSTDSPQTVTIQNIGNQSLTFPVLGTGNNPSISTGFTWNSSGSGDCGYASTTALSLAVEASCAFPVSFTPQFVGNTTGQLVLTDNTLYAQSPNYATQTIPLNGTGTGPVLTVTADSYTIPQGSSIPTLEYIENGTLGISSCSGTPTLTTTATSTSPLGTYPVTITIGSLKCGAYSSITLVNGTITITKAQKQLTLTTSNATIVYGTAIPSLSTNYTLTGFASGDSQATACTGAPVISTLATSSSPVGTYPILADVGSLVCSTSSTTYIVYIVNTGFLTITKDSPVLTWAPVPSTLTYGSPMVAGQFDADVVNANNSVDLSSNAYGTFAYSLTTVGGTAIGVGTILPAGSDTICVKWTPVTYWATDYNSVSKCITITVGSQSVTIAWTPTPNPTYYGVPPTTAGDFAAQASATVNGTVTNVSADGTFAYYLSNNCSGTTFSTSTVLAVGTDNVSVKWTPSSSYTSQFSTTCFATTIAVNAAPTQINWTPSPASWTFGAGVTAGILDATVTNTATGANPTTITADGTVSYKYGATTVTAGYTTLPLGADQICATWTPTSPTYTGDFQTPTSNCITFNVGVATPILGWTPGTTTFAYGTTFGTGNTDATIINNTTSANSSVSTYGSFTYTYNGNAITSSTVLPAGTDNVCVTWTASSSYTADFNGTSPSTVCQNFNVSAVSPTLAWAPTPTTITYGTAIVAGQLNATVTSGGTNVSADGTFSYTYGGNAVVVGTILPYGSDSVCVTWTPTSAYAGDFSATTPTQVCKTFSVTAATPVLAWSPNPTTITYGAALTAGTLDATLTIGGVSYAADGTFTYKYGATVETVGSMLPAGGDSLCVTWTPIAADASWFNATNPTTICKTITVNKQTATLTLTATNGTQVYGTTPVVSSDYTLTGFVNGDTQATACTGAPTITSTTNNTTAVGTYTNAITASATGLTCASDANVTYTISVASAKGTMTVTQATTTISWSPNPTTINYGTTLVAGQLNAVAYIDGTVNESSNGTFVYTYGGTTVTAGYTLPAGSDQLCVTFTPKSAYTTDFTTATACTTINVSQVTPTITYSPQPNSIPYGTGLVVAQLSGGVTVTINNGNTNVTADGTTAFTYGGSAVTVGSILPGGTDSVCVTWTPTNAYTADFTAVSTCSNITVNKVNTYVTYAPTPTPITYGTALVATQFNAQAFIQSIGTNVTADGTFAYTWNGSPIAVGAILPVGTQTICANWTPSSAYTADFIASNLCSTIQVNKASGSLTLTTTSVSVPYGTAIPSVSGDYTLTGFLGTDTAAICTGAPSLTTTATSSSPVGAYPITATLNTLVCASANATYTITIVSSGNVNITKATGVALTLTTTSISVPYGSVIPSVAGDYTLTGFIGGDTAAVCSGAPSLTTTATSSSPVGAYPITATLNTLACSSANATYTVTIVNSGNVNITATSGTLTLTTTSVAVPYGSAIPSVAGDYTLTGFIGGNTSAICTGAPSLTTTATATSPVGAYPILATLNTLVCTTGNVTYTINIVDSGNVNIIQATNVPLTLTTTNQTITYGTTPNVVNDYTLSGFVGTDTSVVCSGTPNITTTATATSAIGTYPITYQDAGTLVCSSANATYVISTANSNGVLTIADMSGTGTSDNFGQVQVGTTSAPGTLTFTFSTAGYIGSTSVLTTGLTGLDFADAGTGTCDTNGANHYYNAGDTCTVVVSFTPKYPGLRTGAVEIVDGDGNIVATSFIQGVGVGPESIFAINNGITYLPASTTTVGTGFTIPAGLAVDGSSNVFVTDSAKNTVSQVFAVGGYTTVQGVGSSGNFNAPEGIAIDGAGNLFVSDSGHNAVKEIVADGGYSVVKTIYTTTSAPGGVAVDGSGNLFISYPNSTTAPVVELTYASGYTAATVIGASHFTNAGGVALDSNGNLYVTDTGSGKLLEFTIASSYASFNTLSSGLAGPTGIALDSNANAYLNLSGASVVSLYEASSSYTNPISLGQVSGVSGYGIALDGAANLFAINATTGQVEEFSYAVAPSLNFAATPYYTASSDSPQAVTLFNFGNAALTSSVPSTGNNPSLSSIDFTLATGTGDCAVVASGSASASLNASQFCNLPVSYIPQPSGATSGTLTLTDNSLNVNNATQVINLNATAPTEATTTISWTPVPATLTYGQPVVSGQLDAQAFVGVTNVSGDGTFTYTYNGSPLTAGTYLPAGNDQVCVTFTPSSAYSADVSSASTCITIVVTQATNVPLTLTTTSVSVPYDSAIPSVAGDYSLTGFIGSDTSAVCSGTPSLTTTATQGSAVGAYPITATLGTLVCTSANASYVIAIVNSGNVNITQTTTTISWTPAPVVYGTALGSGQFDAKALAGAVDVSAEGTFTYYIGSVGGTVATTSTIAPNSSFTLCVQFVPSSAYAADVTTASQCVVETVTATPLTITATALATAVYNTSVPNSTFTYTLSGFVNGDTVAVCSGTPTLSTPAVQGSPVGIYTINVSTSGFTCPGYTFLINTGELHITPATLLIKAVPLTVSYNSQVPSTYSFTCSFDGTVLGTNSCGAYAFTGTPTISTTATKRASTTPGVVYYTSNVGTYALNSTWGSLKSSSANYTFGFASSTLTIAPAPNFVTLTANNFTIKAGAALPTLTYKTTGLLNWDTLATTTTGAPSLQVIDSLGNPVTSTTTKGTYTIQILQNTLTLDSYSGLTDYSGIVVVNGTLTIN